MNQVQYKQDTTATSRPSPGLWADCNFLEAVNRGDIVLWDDFFNAIGTDTVSDNRYIFLDTNGTIAFQTDAVGGSLRISNDGTDNCGPVLTYCDNVAGLVKFSAGKKLWFEARIEPQQVATQNIFVGLGEEALAVDNGWFTDGDAIVDKDYVGFKLLAADADTFDTVYNTAGGTPVTVKADATDITAGTAIKLGFAFDGYRLKFYVDGVELADSALMTATGFPDGEEMVPYIAVKNGTNAARAVDVDWIRLVAER